jgi:hypothetical protein
VREVLLAIVHSLELAAVDRDAGFVEQVQIAAERDEPAANAPDRRAIVAAEIGARSARATSPIISMSLPSGSTGEPHARCLEEATSRIAQCDDLDD